MAMETQRLPCPRIERGQQHLLPEQEVSLRQFFQERLAAMLSCAPINEHEAEEHLSQVYRALGLEAPRIRWFDSPLAFIAAYAPQWRTNSYGTEVGKSIQHQLDDLTEQVLLGIWETASDTLWEQVEGSLPETGAWDSVGTTIWMHVYNEISQMASEEYMVWAEPFSFPKSWSEDVTNRKWETIQWKIESNRLWEEGVQDMVRAYREQRRLACFRFFHKVCEENTLIYLARLNEMVSGYRLGDAEAWLIRKPVRLERDEQGRLHSADGMCIQYPDGWGFYAWHGVRCPEHYMLGKITRADWLREANLELRRVIEERLGPEQFVALVGERCIHHSKRGMLMEVDLPDDPERVAHYLKVRDPSTGRRYYLRVPPSITNADEAAAWTFGLDTATYQPDQEA
jgi:hypothetical protein